MTDGEAAAHLAIRDVIARYTVAGDRLEVAPFVATFADDAVLEAWDRTRTLQLRHTGRGAIARWMTGWRDAALSGRQVHAATFVRHHLSTCAIMLDAPDHATARTYWTAWTDIGADHSGTYDDRLVCREGRWLIAHRRIREDWRAAGSLFDGAPARSPAP